MSVFDKDDFYIDESGSMTVKYASDFPYFVIALVRVLDDKKLKHIYKKLYTKHSSYFQSTNGKNKEIKGAKLTPRKKKWLAMFLDKPGLIEVYYVIVYNEELINDSIYKNKARAFNYLLGKKFEHLFKTGVLYEDEVYLYIDNRNVKNDSLKSLEDYLYVKFVNDLRCALNFKVDYYDSKNVKFIQIADFFSNLLYSELMTSFYGDEIDKLVADGVIKGFFKFPLKQVSDHQFMNIENIA